MGSRRPNWPLIGFLALGLCIVVGSLLAGHGRSNAAVGWFVIWIGVGSILSALRMRTDAQRTKHLPGFFVVGRILGLLPLWAEQVYWIFVGVIVICIGLTAFL